MYAVEKVSSLITRGVYTVSGPFHPFGGAVDIIVVQQEDGSFKSSPWYVRFGKFQGVLKTREKIVNIAVNGAEAGFHMYLDSNGEAFFLRDADPNAEGGEFVVSPASSGDEREDQMQNSQLRKSKSTTFDSSDVAADVGVGRIVTRTSSRRTTILERVFGQRSGKGNAHAMDRVNSLERAEIAAELLETKWSTNLSTRRSRTGGPNDRPSKSNVMDASNGDQGAVAEMVLRENGFDHSEAWASNYENVNGESSSPPGGRDSSEDGNNHYLASARVEDESIEIHTHETGDLTGTTTPTTDQPRSEPPLNGLGRINSSDESIDSHHELIDNSEGVARGEILIEDVTSNGIVGIHTIEAGTMNDKTEVGSQFVTVDSDGPDLNYSDADSPSCDATDVASEIHAVQLLASSQDASQEQVVVISSSETMESLNVLSGITDEKVHDGVQLVECSETVDVSLTGGGQLEELLEDSIEKCGQSISKERPLSYNNDSSNKEYMKKLDVQDREIFVVEYSNSQIYKVNCPDKNGFVDVIANDHSTNSAHDLACGQDLVFPDSSSRVIEVLGSAPENVHPEDVTMNSTGENETCKADVEASCTQTSTEEVETMECITPSASFLDEIESESVSNVCESSNLSKDIEAQDIIIGDDANKSCSMDGAEFGLVSGAISIHREAAEAVVSFSDIVQEMQFQFSDTESFVDRDTTSDMTANEEAVMGEHGELVSSGDYAEEQEGNNINHEKNSENCSDSSRLDTSSIPIPGSKLFLEDDTLEASSLPNLRSHIHDLERSDSLQLSRSLGSNAENSGVDSVSVTKFGFSELAPEGTSDSEKNNDAPELARNAAPDHKHADGLKVELFNPFVELSLCKHLLYEGMGEDAARKAFDSEKVTLEKFRAMRQSLIKTNKLAVRIAGHYFPWDVAAPIVLGMVSFREEQVFEPPQGMIKVEQVGAIVASSGSWRIWPFSFRRARTVNTVRSVRESSDNDSFTPPDKVSCGESNKLTPKKVERKVRSLTPTSQELASLNLREGRNVVTFTFSTAMLGRQQVDARVYLWKWNTRIVISDVDGTITKSDVLGQFMPLVGVDWSQTGVAHLFSAIKENGYQLLFLSARAISQAHLTRQFLFNLKQDGKALPDGPVVISPDGLFPSLYREVIRRAPHEFKISCLEVIKALFPSGSNPFYAGFGNRDTDELSYLKVGIPTGKIFIINPKGEVAVNRRVDTKSYSSLHALVNRMFPPSSCEQEDYNSWNYWKMPLPSVDN